MKNKMELSIPYISRTFYIYNRIFFIRNFITDHLFDPHNWIIKFRSNKRNWLNMKNINSIISFSDISKHLLSKHLYRSFQKTWMYVRKKKRDKLDELIYKKNFKKIILKSNSSEIILKVKKWKKFKKNKK